MSEIASSAASPQQLRALELRNRVRRARSELRTAIAEGQVSAADVILICPSASGSVRIVELLESQRGWGEGRVRTFLAQVAVREDKMIQSLTEQQRRAIASLLTQTVACADPWSAPVP
jgi:hypothetical protein